MKPKRTKPAPVADDRRMLDALWRETVVREVLPNGLTLVLKPDRSSGLASVQVWVKTGSIHENRRLGAGLSHYLEHLLFKGTSRRQGREISSTVQAHGGAINAYTTFDHTVYYVDLPGEHAGVAVDVLADMVLNSTLPADEVAREKDVILREIAMTRDDPDTRVWETLFSTAFREHPYRHPIIGHLDVFSAITRDDLLEYYRARYAPENLTVVVVGDVEVGAVRSLVERHFGSAVRTGMAPVPVASEPLQLGPREAHRRDKVEVTRAIMAWPIPGLAHPDAPALDLLAMALGHGDSSILWQRVRERAGLVHTIDASSWNPGTSGLFCVTFSCEPANRAAAEAEIGRTISRAAFTADQVRKSRRQILVGEINTRKTVSGQASRLGSAEVVVGDLAYSRDYFRRLGEVTPSGLRRVLREYLVPGRLTSVSLGPAEPESAAAQAPSGSGVPDFTETVLPNGARLLVQTDRRLPNLHLRFLIQAGPLYEDPARRGSTALLATLLTKDTRRRSAAAVAQSIEEVGGSFYPVSGNSSLGVAVEVLPGDADRALEILAGAVLEPAFSPETVAREREAQLASLRQDADDVVTFARKLVRRKFFGDHPLALDAQGDETGVGRLGPADLSGLLGRLRVGSNVVLAATGDIPAGFGAKLQRFLSRIPKGRVPGLPARNVAPPSDATETRACEQAVVLQAFPSPALHAPDYIVGEVADELFSGMASRLFERVREEKGLAYFVRSTRIAGLDRGMFCFYAGTAPGKEADVLAEIDAEIARVGSGGVEPAELERCQTRLKAARRQSLQTNGSRALQAALDALQGRPINDGKRYGSRVDAVTVADLAGFAGRYFDRKLRTQLVVRP